MMGGTYPSFDPSSCCCTISSVDDFRNGAAVDGPDERIDVGVELIEHGGSLKQENGLFLLHSKTSLSEIGTLTISKTFINQCAHPLYTLP